MQKRQTSQQLHKKSDKYDIDYSDPEKNSSKDDLGLYLQMEEKNSNTKGFLLKQVEQKKPLLHIQQNNQFVLQIDSNKSAELSFQSDPVQRKTLQIASNKKLNANYVQENTERRKQSRGRVENSQQDKHMVKIQPTKFTEDNYQADFKNLIQSPKQQDDSEFEDQDEEENISPEEQQDILERRVSIAPPRPEQQKNQEDTQNQNQPGDDDLQSPQADQSYKQASYKLSQKETKLQNQAEFILPLISSGVSMSPDMKFGWKPKEEITGAPIPLYYDFEQFQIPINPLTNEYYDPLYLGPRYKHSLALHKVFANLQNPPGPQSLRQSYNFKVPPNIGMIEQIIKNTHRQEEPREFLGMNPKLDLTLNNELVFDSNFESGNLDMVIKTKEYEYDLYMRVDTNTRGHHQWFYFSVQQSEQFYKQKVKFNIVNFTKKHSLYSQGMRIIIGKRSQNFKWQRGGDEISYGNSRVVKRTSSDKTKVRYYSMLSFTHTFSEREDQVYFSYSYPYSFSKLNEFLADQKVFAKAQNLDYIKEEPLCKSLGGVDIPLLTISSRLNSEPSSFHLVNLNEFDNPYSQVSLPFYKRKKIIMVTARVHPGESNSSFMMQGFIKYLLGDSLQSQEIRKRCIFKIVPMINVDGVVVGNYRTSMSGNDLNRKYHAPDEKLHPEVCAIKQLISNITNRPESNEESGDKSNQNFEDEVSTFIDMHGHSRKKNVFIYGPYYPLHSDKYLKMRIIPKLLSEETTKFRYFSCKFRIERSKEKAARIVLWREFNIVNCFTFEASFHGYINDERQTEEFNEKTYEKMGEHLVNSIYEYFLIIEEEERQRKQKQLNKKKKKQKNAEEKSKKKGVKEANTDGQNTTQAGNESPSKRTSPRIKSSLEENKQSQSFATMTEKRLSNFSPTVSKVDGTNPNEPPSEDLIPGQQRQSPRRTVASTFGASLLTRGIRSLKQIFKQLKKDEKTRSRLEKIEDEENKGDDSDDQDAGGSGSDSDPLEDELTGNEQNVLMEDIKDAISQFNDYYNGNKKPIKLKKPKPQLSNKKDLAAAAALKKQQDELELKQKQQNAQNQQLKKKKVNSEEQRRASFQPHMQKSRIIQNNAANQLMNKSPVPIYGKQNIMNSGYYIITNKQNQSSGMGENPLIINKIVTDLKGIEYVSKAPMQSNHMRNIQNLINQHYPPAIKKPAQNKISHSSNSQFEDLQILNSSNGQVQNLQQMQFYNSRGLSQKQPILSNDLVSAYQINGMMPNKEYFSQPANYNAANNNRVPQSSNQQNLFQNQQLQHLYEQSQNNNRRKRDSSTKDMTSEFDVGLRKRKGKNNTPVVQRNDNDFNSPSETQPETVGGQVDMLNLSGFSIKNQVQSQFNSLYQKFHQADLLNLSNQNLMQNMQAQSQLQSSKQQLNQQQQYFNRAEANKTSVKNLANSNATASNQHQHSKKERRNLMNTFNQIDQAEKLYYDLHNKTMGNFNYNHDAINSELQLETRQYKDSFLDLSADKKLKHKQASQDFSNEMGNREKAGKLSYLDFQERQMLLEGSQMINDARSTSNPSQIFEEKLQQYYLQQQQLQLMANPQYINALQAPSNRENTVFQSQMQKYQQGAKKRSIASPKSIIDSNSQCKNIYEDSSFLSGDQDSGNFYHQREIRNAILLMPQQDLLSQKHFTSKGLNQSDMLQYIAYSASKNDVISPLSPIKNPQSFSYNNTTASLSLVNQSAAKGLIQNDHLKKLDTSALIQSAQQTIEQNQGVLQRQIETQVAQFQPKSDQQKMNQFIQNHVSLGFNSLDSGGAAKINNMKAENNKVTTLGQKFLQNRRHSRDQQKQHQLLIHQQIQFQQQQKLYMQQLYNGLQSYGSKHQLQPNEEQVVQQREPSTDGRRPSNSTLQNSNLMNGVTQDQTMNNFQGIKQNRSVNEYENRKVIKKRRINYSSDVREQIEPQAQKKYSDIAANSNVVTVFNQPNGLIKYNSAGRSQEIEDRQDAFKGQVKYSGVDSVDSKSNYIKFFNQNVENK